jgi:hypothetical protein
LFLVLRILRDKQGNAFIDTTLLQILLELFLNRHIKGVKLGGPIEFELSMLGHEGNVPEVRCTVPAVSSPLPQ